MTFQKLDQNFSKVQESFRSFLEVFLKGNEENFKKGADLFVEEFKDGFRKFRPEDPQDYIDHNIFPKFFNEPEFVAKRFSDAYYWKSRQWSKPDEVSFIVFPVPMWNDRLFFVAAIFRSMGLRSEVHYDYWDDADYSLRIIGDINVFLDSELKNTVFSPEEWKSFITDARLNDIESEYIYSSMWNEDFQPGREFKEYF